MTIFYDNNVNTESSFINVRSFGALGNGVSDDTTAIQNAINQALLQSNHTSLTSFNTASSTPVYFPAGIYIISSTITIGGNLNNFHSRISLIGDGRQLSVIKAQSGTTDSTMPNMLDFTPVNSPTIDANSGWSISKLGFEGVNPWTSASITAINMKKSSYANIDDCFFRYFDKGIEIRNWSNKIDKSRFEYCTMGIYFSEESGIDGASTINHNSIINSDFATCNYGIVTARSLPISLLNIYDNQFDGNSNAAILFNGPIEQFNIDKNYFELQGAGGSGLIQTNNSGGTAYVDGAIIIHPTTNNNSAGNGTISNNFFINCNATNIISASANRQLNILNNRVDGSAVTNFLTLENVVGVSSGPLPYTTTQRILVEQSKEDSGGNDILSKIVNITNSNLNGNTRIVCKDLTSFQGTPFVFNNISAMTAGGGSSGVIVKTSGIDGGIEWTHDIGTGSLNRTISFDVTPSSPLSGALLRIVGQCKGDDGTGGILVRFTDGGTTDLPISVSFSSGVWSASRNNSYYVSPQSSGSRTVTIQLYRVGGVTATNVSLKNFCICDAKFDLGTEPLSLI